MKRGKKNLLVEFDRVRVTLGGRPALQGASWSICRGDGWLVTGSNGAGKTTLLRVLAGRIWPDPGVRGGRRLYHFDSRASASPIDLEGRLAWLSPETHQRFARLEPSPLARDVLLTGYANTFLLTQRPAPAQCAAALLLARKLGVEKMLRQPFAELSQGQQRLVLLARALAPNPELLVLDEFSDGLDATVRERVGGVIRQRLRAGAAVVVAAHRGSDVLPGLTRHLELKNGRARENKNGVRGLRTKVQAIKEKRAKPLAVGTSPKKSLTLFFKSASIVVGDHERTKTILHNLDWTVSAGEQWAVLGSNGSGKSTLLRAVYGELSVARGGTLQRFGASLKGLPLPGARRRMGWVSPALQHHYAASLSVVEVVASGFQSTIGLLRNATRTELKQARATLRRLGIGHLAGRAWGELSFGEARLTLLARALAPRPRLLLLDEPCDGLSPAARRRFLAIIDQAARAGVQILMAAHRGEDLPACINRTLRLHNGRVI